MKKDTLLIGTFTGYFLGSFFKVITFTSSFSVLFRSKELSSSLFPSIFLKVKYLPKDSVFRVYFLIFSTFVHLFGPFFLTFSRTLICFQESYLYFAIFSRSKNLNSVYFTVYFSSKNLTSVYFTVYFSSKNLTSVYNAARGAAGFCRRNILNG